MFCSSCNHPVEDPDALFCSDCGERLHKENSCAICGKPYQPNARFCGRCGTPAGSTIARCRTPLYCKGSGSAILPGDRYFQCDVCGEIFLEQYHYDNKPLCVDCAVKQASVGTAAIVTPAESTTPQTAQPISSPDLTTRIAESDWALIHGGEFQMGSPPGEKDRFDHERKHEVQINTFEMLKTPVTFSMYDAYCEARDRDKPNDEGWGHERRPVINVDYWSAQRYINWLRKRTGWHVRLPTEAEWEYACRAGTTTPFWTGETITTEQANFDGSLPPAGQEKGVRRGMTTPVDQFPPNPWGLHDMHGNVWEWCSSEYDAEYTGMELLSACKDTGNPNPRILRGGSWSNVQSVLRSASRNKFGPNLHFLKIGFRLVREIK